jgi:hypothetical protein
MNDKQLIVFLSLHIGLIRYMTSDNSIYTIMQTFKHSYSGTSLEARG